MNNTAKIIAVLMIFFVLTSGGVVLVVVGEREIGNMMITAGVSFVMGVGIVIIDGRSSNSRGRDSSPPPFNPRKRMGTPPHYVDKPFDKNKNGDR